MSPTVSSIGIRREDKHRFERRVPLTPEGVRGLIDTAGLDVVVQTSPIRVFEDDEYRDVGATVAEDLSSCGVVLAVKEIPIDLLRADTTYVFFSHTIKGQSHNMPLLQRLIDLRCTLVDYERIVDDDGRRLVFFGRHAGLAGMIDTLSVLGDRLESLGFDTPFAELPLSHEFDSLEGAKEGVRRLGQRLREQPLPASLSPFVVGITGDGNVSRGAQEIYDLLGVESIEPDELSRLTPSGSVGRLFKVVFAEQHFAKPTRRGATFDLAEYYKHPDRYEGRFGDYARFVSVLVNAIYWTEDYPRLLPNVYLRDWWSTTRNPRLLVVGDISCDIDGSVECTVKATTPDRPAYVYDPISGSVTDGVAGPGLCLMTTDCLPCELPREASDSFTVALAPFVPAIATFDRSSSFEAASIPDEIRRGTILWRGELTPDYEYLREHLSG